MEFIHTLILVLTEVTYSPGDVIMRQGDIGEEMYFIIRGSCDVLNSEWDTVKTLRENEYFGEIALLAQRADVAEELDRLQIHVEEARGILAAKGPHGRRLDFLTQELNREANTLGAKSTMAESSQKAVDLKVIIEQIREQVQNLE